MRTKAIEHIRYPALFAQTYLAVAAEYGLSSEQILQEAQISSAEIRSEIGITRVAFEQLLDVIDAHIGDQGAGLSMGWRLPPTAFGSLGQAVLASDTLGNALRLCERFWNLFGMAMTCQLEVSDELCTFEVKALNLVLSRHQQMVLESTIASIWRCCLLLLPELKSQAEIWFCFPEPPYVGMASKLLGKVCYDKPTTRIGFPAFQLNTPLSMHNPFGLKSAVEQCEKDIAMSRYPRVANSVQRELTLGPDGYPDFTKIAARLCVSPRTLRRHLNHEGIHFQALLNAVRKEDALRMLSNTTLEIQQIAQLLGYQEPANFTRAFKQWMGITPVRFRANLRTALE
ncbi:MAG: AraC family transcriptional regulator ligand-binding domain-containing protein [Hahellaceae bacterium]|nr:AraC family transcriptional regulator ligand-binding domain-containing protein [Hahellaceae bacterium]MCP5169141.1 AraC family transcriptional regulator ligand-binding domain-containing protein [Hahellaceae bacterium]